MEMLFLDLPSDVLGHIFLFIAFKDLVQCVKRVCKRLCSQSRRVLCAGGDCGRFALHPKTFPSARDAFDAIGAGRRLETRFVRHVCRSLLRLPPCAWRRCDPVPDSMLRADPKRLLCYLFVTCGVRGSVLDEPVRLVEVRESAICVFADVYRSETTRLYDFVQLCREHGLEVCAFEYFDPRDSGDFVPKKRSVAMHVCGHRELYRGILVGLVFETR
jgi:hypothetical protein